MANILDLPTELLVEISQYLHLPARLAFKISEKYIYLTLPAIKPSQQDLSTLSQCAAYAISNHMLFDKDRKCCALCKQWYPNHLFGSTTNRTVPQEEDELERVLRDGHSWLGGPGMVELPEDICAWERSRFVSLLELHPPRMGNHKVRVKDNEEACLGWLSKLECVCMHCGNVKVPRHSRISGYPIRNSTCICDCDTCGSREIRTYVQDVLKDQNRRCKSVIWKDAKGETWAREWIGTNLSLSIDPAC